MEKIKNKGIGGHQSHKMIKDEWLTPPEIVQALGKFDLDPCDAIVSPFVTANKHYTIADDGLNKEWFGRVWLNPPYGYATGLWLEKLAKHNNGIALIFARTETEMFVKQVWEKADALFFLYGRLFFYHSNGQRAKSNSGAPSVLIAYGKNNVEIMKNCGLSGKIIEL